MSVLRRKVEYPNCCCPESWTSAVSSDCQRRRKWAWSMAFCPVDCRYTICWGSVFFYRIKQGGTTILNSSLLGNRNGFFVFYLPVFRVTVCLQYGIFWILKCYYYNYTGTLKFLQDYFSRRLFSWLHLWTHRMKQNIFTLQPRFIIQVQICTSAMHTVPLWRIPWPATNVCRATKPTS